MKKLVLSVALFFVAVTMSCALELVPKPAEMRQGTREVRLRSTEPLVEITEDGQIVLKAGSSKAAVWGRHTVEQLLAQARRKGA